MGASQYASSFGRLQSIAINFLSEEFLQNLLKANSVTEMVKQLESTWYGEEIKKSASVYKEAELLEVAFNRHIVETNKIISEATPFSGKNAVRAYLSKWDLYNIELILSSKAMGREITETAIAFAFLTEKAFSISSCCPAKFKPCLNFPTEPITPDSLIWGITFFFFKNLKIENM